jgi:hypothetical protein
LGHGRPIEIVLRISPSVRRLILVDVKFVVRDRDDQVDRGLEALEPCHAGWILVDGDRVVGLCSPTGERWRELRVRLVRTDAQRTNNHARADPVSAHAPA